MASRPAQHERNSHATTGSPRHLQLTSPVALEAERVEAAGRREIARRLYESALYLLRRKDDASEASTILRRVGRLYIDEGDFDAGIDCLTAAIAVAEALDDSSAVAYAMNIMAYAYLRRGDLEQALELYTQTLNAAQAARDVKLEAMAEQNLGNIATMQGDTEKALDRFAKSLEGYRSLGLDEFLGTLMNNIGLAHANLGQWDEADRIYMEALAQCATFGDVTTGLMIEANRVEVRIAKGELDEAASITDRVLRRAEALGDFRAATEARKHRGVIARANGRFEDAENCFRSAFASALDREDLMLAAEVAREQAELFTVLRRNRETLQALTTSHRLFQQLRARRELADVSSRMRRLEARFLDLVREWASSIDAKDRYTLGHCERVASYACVLAENMGFDETRLFWFRIGALLHDVGKIAVPLEILNKPGTLTAEERIIIESHARAGADLLRDIDFPWDILPIVRSHHERWDGAGYPDRLAGDDIPLDARILCVADVFDALTSDRPYRRALARGDALDVMLKDVGAFDPEILERFTRLVPLFPSMLFSSEAAPASKPLQPRLTLVA